MWHPFWVRLASYPTTRDTTTVPCNVGFFGFCWSHVWYPHMWNMQHMFGIMAVWYYLMYRRYCCARWSSGLGTCWKIIAFHTPAFLQNCPFKKQGCFHCQTLSPCCRMQVDAFSSRQSLFCQVWHAGNGWAQCANVGVLGQKHWLKIIPSLELELHKKMQSFCSRLYPFFVCHGSGPCGTVDPTPFCDESA